MENGPPVLDQACEFHGCVEGIKMMAKREKGGQQNWKQGSMETWRRKGMGHLEAEKGGRVLGVDLEAESRKKKEMGCLEKEWGCCVMGRHSRGKEESHM